MIVVKVYPFTLNKNKGFGITIAEIEFILSQTSLTLAAQVVV